MNLKQLLTDFIVKRQESALLWQVFQDDSKLSQLARQNFERVLQMRGIALNDSLLRQARAAAMLDRTLTIGAFLDQRPQKGRRRS